MMDVKARITAIGSQALTDGDAMVILFNETASAALREVAVIQKFEQPAEQGQIKLHANDVLTIGDHDYPIVEVGQLVNNNLQTIGHVTLIFGKNVPTGLQNALHFAPGVAKPEFKVGTEIVYHFQTDRD